jgi:hypothetical protein
MYDTLLDLHNYSAMALMLMKEERESVKDGEDEGVPELVSK